MGPLSLIDLARMIDAGQWEKAIRLVGPETAHLRFENDLLLEKTTLHWLYRGDHALQLFAATHLVHRLGPKRKFFSALVNMAQNRRGLSPLHVACDAVVDHPGYRPADQVKSIGALLAMGASPDTLDKNKKTPLERAIRCRSCAAVKALLQGKTAFHPDPRLKKSIQVLLTHSTGRGFSGMPAAQLNLARIRKLLIEERLV